MKFIVVLITIAIQVNLAEQNSEPQQDPEVGDILRSIKELINTEGKKYHQVFSKWKKDLPKISSYIYIIFENNKNKFMNILEQVISSKAKNAANVKLSNFIQQESTNFFEDALNVAKLNEENNSALLKSILSYHNIAYNFHLSIQHVTENLVDIIYHSSCRKNNYRKYANVAEKAILEISKCALDVLNQVPLLPYGAGVIIDLFQDTINTASLSLLVDCADFKYRDCVLNLADNLKEKLIVMRLSNSYNNFPHVAIASQKKEIVDCMLRQFEQILQVSRDTKKAFRNC